MVIQPLQEHCVRSDTENTCREMMYNYKKYVHNFISFLYIIIFYTLLSHVLSLSFAGEKDKIFWDKKYEKEAYIFGKEPVEFLGEHIDLLPRERRWILQWERDVMPYSWQKTGLL